MKQVHRIINLQRRNIMFALVLVTICVIGASLGQILLKQGMIQVGEIHNLRQLFSLQILNKVFTNRYVILGLVLYGIISILWLGAMSTLNVSYMYPLLSLAYVVTALIAMFFLKENVTLSQWAGILLVVGGCFLIIRS